MWVRLTGCDGRLGEHLSQLLCSHSESSKHSLRDQNWKAPSYTTEKLSSAVRSSKTTETSSYLLTRLSSVNYVKLLPFSPPLG